ncbi:MAG: trypsin-like peptidase domain-containing protein [Candidatus Melainabacteria bacterium]|nr:trypsin-like peptidase domain-containing protein [Candidatus Melainabacteria bacterium]MBI3308866.1 trypsin-like peptidase domain-containing protein [Candidatus Melainabacteria bacterium]
MIQVNRINPISQMISFKKPMLEASSSKDLDTVLDQGKNIINNIDKVKEEPDVKIVLKEIKDFIQDLVSKLSEMNTELKSKITLDDIQEVVKMVAPSAVMITGVSSIKSLGSGVIINGRDNKKYILTNAHVVDGIDMKQEREDFGFYRIFLYNGDDDSKPIQLIASPVTVSHGVIAYSPPEEHDLALLEIIQDIKLPETVGVKLRDINEDPVLPGEPLIAIGSPFGLKDSITFGIASNVNRRIPINKNTYIKTDAAIGPGSSGGGLFDMKGRLVGINSLAIGNIGGAIRIDEVTKLLEHWGISSKEVANKNTLNSFSLAA